MTDTMTGNYRSTTTVNDDDIDSCPPPPQSSSPQFIEVEEEKPLKISSHTTEVACRFCQHVNPIDKALMSNTIECKACTHETPIQDLKDGRIFVRCACGWLTITDPSDFPVLCNCCRKMLQLKVTVRQRILRSYVCSYCNQRFETEEDIKFWRCPMCNKKSSLGKNYSAFRAAVYIVIGLLFIGGDAAFIGLTLHKARDHGGMYIGWAGFFIIGVGFLIGGLFYCQIRKSNVYKPLKEV